MTPKKIDRRILRTRKLLRDALIYLTLEVGFYNISIRDLTNRANIGYATFYRHFKTKDELLAHMLNSTVDELHKCMHPNMTSKEESVAFFRHIQLHRGAYLAGLSIPRDHPAILAVHAHMEQVLAERYQARYDCVIPLEISFNHIIRSADEFIRWYLDNEDNYSPEEIAVIYNELIVKATEGAALELRQNQADAADDN